MTDIHGSQLAVVTPTVDTDTSIQVSQVAIVTPITQVANGVYISQVAIVQIDIEYIMPTFYTPFYIPALWGAPLWIQK